MREGNFKIARDQVRKLQLNPSLEATWKAALAKSSGLAFGMMQQSTPKDDMVMLRCPQQSCHEPVMITSQSCARNGPSGFECHVCLFVGWSLNTWKMHGVGYPSCDKCSLLAKESG